jgi:hypothetical protein
VCAIVPRMEELLTSYVLVVLPPPSNICHLSFFALTLITLLFKTKIIIIVYFNYNIIYYII